MDIDKKIDELRIILDSIQPNKLTILTGSNGSGKSLIRKQLCFHLSKKLNVTPDRLVVHSSMQIRTALASEMGGLSAFTHDDPTEPTSLSTFDLFETLLRSFIYNDERTDKVYIVLDEPEIGMTKESQYGFILELKKKLKDILDKSYGILIITNSEFLVQMLKYQCLVTDFDFFNMDGYKDADKWLSRDIKPTNFDELRKDSRELYLYLNGNDNKKKCKNKTGDS